MALPTGGGLTPQAMGTGVPGGFTDEQNSQVWNSLTAGQRDSLQTLGSAPSMPAGLRAQAVPSMQGPFPDQTMGGGNAFSPTGMFDGGGRPVSGPMPDGSTGFNSPAMAPFGSPGTFGGGMQGGGYGTTFGGGGTQGPGSSVPGSLPQSSGQFLPQILTSPFVDGMSALNNSLGFQTAAMPGASAFQQAFYGPYGYANLLGQLGGAGVQGANQFEQNMYNQGLNPLEAGLFETGSRLGTQQLNHASNLGQLQLNEAARLGRRTMADSFNRIDAQYENTPMASSRAPQYDEASNLFAQNLMGQGQQLGSNIVNAGQQFGLGSVQSALQAGLQRQGIGAQLAGNRQNIGGSLAQEGIRNLGQAYGAPQSIVGAQQQGAAGLLGLGQQGMYGMLNPALAITGSIPVQAPTYVQGGGGGGGGKK